MEKDFDKWNKNKKQINDREFPEFVHEREIWWCSIGVNVGDEQDGKNDEFERPVLVLKKFNRRIVLIAPLTTKLKENPYYFSFTHDNTKFAVILSHLRLLSTSRFNRRIRRIDPELFNQIRVAVIEKTLS